MKTGTKKIALTLLSVLLAATAVFAIVFAFGANKDRITDSVAEQGSFNAAASNYGGSGVTLTENYSAVVPVSVRTSGGSLIDHYGSVLLSKDDTTITTQLDNGKKGLLVKSNQAGEDAEGAGIDFSNPLIGDFQLDFRVFSEQSFHGFGNYSMASYDKLTTDSRYNSFLDLKEVAVKITSKKDSSKYFTIYVNGSTLWDPYSPSARCAVADEAYANHGQKGFGIEVGKGYVNYGYPIGTTAEGTSFCNVGRREYNTYTTLKVDMDAMKVYIVSNVATVSSSSVSVETTENLVRDLTTLPTFTDTKGYDAAGNCKTLSAQDFEDGYYTSVVFNDVTPTSQAVEKPSWITSDGNYSKTVNMENTGLTSGRYAQMIIYSLNGQNFESNKGFDVADQSKLYGMEQISWFDSGYMGQQSFYSKDTGLQAEGLEIPFTGTKSGEFEQAFAVYDVKNSVAANQYYVVPRGRINGGAGMNNDGFACSSFVKQVAFEFTSVSDPTKSFSLNINSNGGSGESYAYLPSARVHIPGDKVMTQDFEYGYGLMTGLKRTAKETYASDGNQGKFDVKNQSYLVGAFGDRQNENHCITRIKFDPSEMKVYGWIKNGENGEYALIRDLATNSGTGVPSGLCASLNASDFAEGYTVTFRFVDVRDNATTAGYASNKAWYNNNGTITACGGHIGVDVGNKHDARVTFSGVLISVDTKNKLQLNTSADAKTDIVAPTAKICAKPVPGKEVDMTPTVYGVMSGGAVAGDIRYTVGEESGTISSESGYKFTAPKAGTYTFTYTVGLDGKTYDQTQTVAIKEMKVEFKNVDGTTHSEKTYYNTEFEPTTFGNLKPTDFTVPEGYEFDYWSFGGNKVSDDYKIEFTEQTFTLVPVCYVGIIDNAVSLSLDGKITLNFRFRYPAAEAGNGKAVFYAGADKLQEIAVSSLSTKDGYYVVGIELAVKDCGKAITLKLEQNGVKTNKNDVTYSAYDYVDSADETDAERKALLNELKEYGDVAKTYFDNRSKTDAAKGELVHTDITKETLASYAPVVEGNCPDAIDMIGPRIVLGSEMKIRFYFTISDEQAANALVIKINGSEYDKRNLKARKGSDDRFYYYIEIDNIAAEDFGSAYVIECEDYKITYSVLSYVYTVLSNYEGVDASDMEASEVDLINLCRHIWLYSQKANAYFAG